MTKTPSSRLDELRSQSAELDALIAQGVLTGETARAARDRLEREVLDAVLGPQASAMAGKPVERSRAAPRALLLGFAGFVIVFGGLGYAWRGNFPGLATGPGPSGPAAAADASAGHAQSDAHIESMLNRLAERLKTQPDDADGWSMLARSYTARGRFDEALPAYKRAVDLRPKDAQAWADYADGLASAHEHQLAGEPEKLVGQALSLDPANVKALSLAGTIAYDKSDFGVAIEHWERAIAAGDPASDFTRQLRAALADARQRAGVPDTKMLAAHASSAPAPATTSTPAPDAVITGRVSLSPALASAVGPGDTVFIFARTATGSKMPLAILRRKGSDLPLEFTLDDSSAMSPATRLSSAASVVVSARVSKSGNAMSQPGDLEATSAVIPVGTRGLSVVIADARK